MLLWWDDDNDLGIVVEPAERAQGTFAAIERLRSATSLGELQQADLPSWAASYIGDCVQEVEEGQRDDIWSWDDAYDTLIYLVPLPWDVESVTEWLDRELLEAHADIGGASPGGHIDGYKVRDPDAFFAALRGAGHKMERHPGLLEEYYRAL
jgi:hypothetical protein